MFTGECGKFGQTSTTYFLCKNEKTNFIFIIPIQNSISRKMAIFTYIFKFLRSNDELPQGRQIDDLLAWLDPKLVVSLDNGRKDACREDIYHFM